MAVAIFVTCTLIGMPVAGLIDLDMAGRTSTPSADRSVLTTAPQPTPQQPLTQLEGPVTDPRGTNSNPRQQRVEGLDPTAIPEAGPGTFQVAPAPFQDAGDATTYRVEVEDGLPFAARAIAAFVEKTLSDPRGWTRTGKHQLVRVEHEPDLRILLATPRTADEFCAPLDTGGRLSCRNGPHVVINAWRWINGADSYGDDLIGYRRYVVNHETGHALGYPHVACPRAAARAPVMLQQTKGLNGCRPNPWPNEVDMEAAAH